MNLNDDVVFTKNEKSDSKESQILFSPTPNKPWLMKMSPEGLIFNREDYPSLDANEFANEFISILQHLFTVEIKRKV